LISIPGSPPDLSDPPRGCGFAERCPFALAACRAQRPLAVDVAPDHTSACIRTPDIETMRVAAVKKATWHF
jgi:oligopeptide/dipeptide ABC transporter ATP-binding protein